jgi:hypothetical protein
MDPKLIELVNDKLRLILDEAVFDEQSEKIFKCHYGIDCKRLEPKAISKEVKVSLKKMKIELIRIDNKVFNILKKHDLFTF